MSELENKTPVAFETADLQSDLDCLRRQVTFLLLILVAISFTLTAFLAVQFRRTRKELEGIRPQAMQIIEARKKDGPVIQNFMTKLAEYGQTHPEFAARLARQGIKLNATAPTSALTPPPR